MGIALEDVTIKIKKLKTVKAPGFDGLHNDFFINLVPKATECLSKLFSNIVRRGNLPK